MTACNNNVRGGKASRVITAALVATLSVGTPMAAIASTVSEGGIDMLATDAENVKQGTVSYDGKDGASFVYDEETHGLVPTSLKLGNGTVVDDIELSPSKEGREAGSYYYFYVKLDGKGSFSKDITYKDGDEDKSVATASLVATGSPASYNTPSEIGKYAVIVAYSPVADSTNDQLEYVGTAATFTISAKDLSNASIYEINAEDKDDVSDTTFNYNGSADSLDPTKVADKIGVAVDGVALTKGTDYSVSIVNKGTSATVDDPLKVGETYIVKIDGNGVYEDEYKECELVINKLDLSTADFDMKTIVEAPETSNNAPKAGAKLADIINSINDVKVGTETSEIASDDNADIDVTFVKDPNGYQTSNGTRGEYTFTISADKDSKNVTGSKTVKVLYADYEANISFDQDASATGKLAVNLSADEVEYFDADEITVKYNGENKLKASEYTVSYSDKDGNAVNADALKQPGDYKVTVTVNIKKNGVVVAGTKTLDVNVSYGNVTSDANIFVSYDGENVASEKNDLTYTGEDFAKNISVLAKAGEKTFTEGTDYEVKLQKSVDGKFVDVDKMVDAGTYQLTVKAKTFQIDTDKTTATFKFVVSPLKADKVVVDYTIDNGESSCFPYTGDVITPSFKFYVEDKDGDTQLDQTGTKYTEVEIPTDAYTVEYSLKGKKADLKEVGSYKATLKTAKDIENYVVNFSDVAISVSDAKIMDDVANTAWYAQSVVDALNRGLMRGYEGTNNFGPESPMNRAQVAIVLYRMAGGVNNPWFGNGGDPSAPAFSDVNSEHYAYTEVNWAKAVGVVNGNPDGTFAPDVTISRQQFAIMLANYAKLNGNYKAVDTEAVLANVAGGDEVEGYARDAVAWAVANGFMAQGSDVNPLGTIDRAQAATMLVRFDKFVNGETE